MAHTLSEEEIKEIKHTTKDKMGAFQVLRTPQVNFKNIPIIAAVLIWLFMWDIYWPVISQTKMFEYITSIGLIFCGFWYIYLIAQSLRKYVI